MASLLLHNRNVNSVFELIGVKENDITFSVGWALSKSPAFLENLLHRIFPNSGIVADQIKLQEFKKQEGITDIEIFGTNVHVIVEAKRGWVLPTKEQLLLYVPRLQADPISKNRALVVMSEASAEYAHRHIPKKLAGIPVHYLSWKQINHLTGIKKGTNSEKRLLHELRSYLGGIVKMQNQESNLVYVVALATGTPEWSKISWKDIVNKKNRYFHPFGVKGWPKEPPNYLGFRYDGKLQSIRHVDSWRVVDDLNDGMKEIRKGRKEGFQYLLYDLGPEIKPVAEVRTGNIFRNGKVWVMLDLLLTSKTISEARNKTKIRRAVV